MPPRCAARQAMASVLTTESIALIIFAGAVVVHVVNRTEGCEMAAKKPAKQKKAKDLEISKTKGGETVKGGARAKDFKERSDTHIKF